MRAAGTRRSLQRHHRTRDRREDLPGQPHPRGDACDVPQAKRVLQQRGEGQALQAVALMQQGRVVELSGPLALAAARVSLEHRLPMADSIMLASARA